MKLTSKDQALDQTALTLLRAVEGGMRQFAPEEETVEALAQFQHTVRLMQMLDGRGYFTIDGLNLVAGAGVGGSRINRVRLRGGLTQKGKAVLDYHQRQVA